MEKNQCDINKEKNQYLFIFTKHKILFLKEFVILEL